jgi:hypothetical protein
MDIPAELNARQQQLIDLIEAAFDGVKLGEGIGLNEAIALDDYAYHKERLQARAKDERDDWHKVLDDPELIGTSGGTALTYFDIAGFVFNLPAYLWLAVNEVDHLDWEDPIDRVIGHLTDPADFQIPLHAALSPKQRDCVCQVLSYYDGKNVCERTPKMVTALAHWRSNSSENGANKKER